jgi:hypothetical protein
MTNNTETYNEQAIGKLSHYKRHAITVECLYHLKMAIMSTNIYSYKRVNHWAKTKE